MNFVRNDVQFVVACLFVLASSCAEDLTQEKADIAQMRAYATDNLGKYDGNDTCAQSSAVVEKTSALRRRVDGLNAVMKPLLTQGKRAPLRAAYEAEYQAIDGLIQERNVELSRCAQERTEAGYRELKTKFFGLLPTKGAVSSLSVDVLAGDTVLMLGSSAPKNLYRLLDEVDAACAKRGKVKVEAMIPADTAKRERDAETLSAARSPDGIGSRFDSTARVSEQLEGLTEQYEESTVVSVRAAPMGGDVKLLHYVLTVEPPCRPE